jgi:hypothetical protein
MPDLADATLIQVTDRSALGGDDTFDWALGPPKTAISNPFTATSDSGLLQAEISKPAPQGDFLIYYQSTGGWQGNFGFGDAVLYTTRMEPGPIVIDFSEPVSGAGAQIQKSTWGGFTGVVAAYDSSSGLLGEFTLDGEVLVDTGDNSAIFLGVLSDADDIARIVFSLEGGWSFGINRLDVVAAPEPNTVLLLACGLVGLALRRRPSA